MYETMVNKLQIEREMHVCIYEGMKDGHKTEKLGQERNLENYRDSSIRNNYLGNHRKLDPDNVHHCSIQYSSGRPILLP